MFREHTLCLNWRKLLFIDTSYIKDYIHVSLPMLVTQTMWGASSIIQTAILGNMENAAMVCPGELHLGSGVSKSCRLWDTAQPALRRS